MRQDHLARFRDRLKLLLFGWIVRICDAAGAYGPLSRICARYVCRIADGRRAALDDVAADDARVTVLVLDYDRFRGDIDILSRSPELRFIVVSWNLPRMLLRAFVDLPTAREEAQLPPGRIARIVFSQAEPESRTGRQRERYRAFLRKFLPVFLGGLNVDVVMNSDFRYRREMDLVRVASECGFAHICYYREAMYIVSANYKLAVERHHALRPFHGDIIAVQNEITRKMFIESGIAPADRIVIRGCPRMDGLVEKLRSRQAKASGMRQIAYFSCPGGAQLEDLRYFDFFSTTRQVIRVLAELAIEDPELRVVIKMKDMHIAAQLDAIRQELNVANGGNGVPANVEVELGRMAAQNVIRDSDVVCGMQSTVVLEAGVTGKPVILPHFKTMREAEGADQVLMYKEYGYLFDVADDAEALKALFLARLDNPVVPDDVVSQRRQLFEEHVSSLEGGAVRRSVQLIKETAKRRRMRSVERQQAHAAVGDAAQV
ncbi:MAG: hypothetical protein AB7O70_15110 [Hyphomicrobiales bacterium]